MNKVKKFSTLSAILLSTVILLVPSNMNYSYAASYHYAVTNMTWAEFYEGEVGKSAAELKDDGLDAVSSPTVRVAGRLTQLASDISDDGASIWGIKDVHVRMTDEVYNSLSNDTRYTFGNVQHEEYKDVNIDGSFGKMITDTTTLNDVSVTLSSGASSTWGNYTLNISGANIRLGSGDTRYYLGATLETSDGAIYGLRHNTNLWMNANTIAISVQEFTEPHGITRDYKYTQDLAGKTITKITYNLLDQPDAIINCNVYVKNLTTATVSPEDNSVTYAAGQPVRMVFDNLPSGAVYDKVVSVYAGSGRNRTMINNYTFSDNALTINDDSNFSSGIYTITAVFGTEEYADISTSFKFFSTNATSNIISNDNNKGSLKFLITPAGAVDAIDETMADGNFVNATDYTDPAKNFSVLYSGAPYEIEGSGFSVDITLSDVPSGKTGVVGINKVFTLTRSNYEYFDYLVRAFDSLAKVEGGWILPSAELLNSYGLFIMSVGSDDKPHNITNYASYGMLISGDAIIVSYGTMLIDRALTDSEGSVMMFSPEGEKVISDGRADDHLRAAWYFAMLKTDVEIIPDTDNKAGVEFEIMPSGFYEATDEFIEERKFFWITGDYVSSGTTDYITGNTEQLSGNSGFEISIALTDDIPEDYTPILGFSSVYTFTPDNLGSETYNALVDRIRDLPVVGGVAVMPSGDVLTEQGIHVIARYPNGRERDVTNEMSFGLYTSNISRNMIEIHYGGLALDRALTDYEGERVTLGSEELPLMSDGVADKNITASWYITKNNAMNTNIIGGSGGGCNNTGASIFNLAVLCTLMLFTHRM